MGTFKDERPKEYENDARDQTGETQEANVGQKAEFTRTLHIVTASNSKPFASL